MKRLFFEREVAGESALTRATAARLAELATEVGKAAPWLKTEETDLVLVADDDGQVHAVSVMGFLGEFRAVALYVGPVGYRFFERMHMSGETPDMDLFTGYQHSVRVEFAARSDIEKEDRELLKELAPEVLKGRGSVPVFRTVRPGYMAWFITEEEGRLLALGLSGLLYLLSQGGIPSCGGPPFPLVTWKDGIAVVLRGQPPRAAEAVGVPVFDEDRIGKIKASHRTSKSPLIVDHFYSPTPIGQRNERKMAMRTTVALDGQTGMALAPKVSGPTERTEDLLADTLLTAIEQMGRIPAITMVRTDEYARMLLPLASKLGTRLDVRHPIAPLEELKEMMRFRM
ncbi:MAG: hypothetical protein IT168_20715 [Bryobacterales bacterium]|nr:hypothetical protein [Bryobacterales bacterium]